MRIKLKFDMKQFQQTLLRNNQKYQEPTRENKVKRVVALNESAEFTPNNLKQRNKSIDGYNNRDQSV